jgi:hypothetical protein
MDPLVSDERALPDRTLNLYLYPIVAWGLASVGLFVTGWFQWTLPLAYPLALWHLGLSAVWGVRLLRMLDRNEVTNAEAHEGVRSVGNILAATALLPAIVFLANDPLSTDAWSVTLGAFCVAVAAIAVRAGLTRIASRWSHGAAIAVACFALPVNITGTVTVATMLGLYDTVVDATPVPEEFKPPRPPKGKGKHRDR